MPSKTYIRASLAIYSIKIRNFIFIITKNFNFRIKKGEKIGVIGVNGSGKSTFIKLLTKQLETQTGQVNGRCICITVQACHVIGHLDCVVISINQIVL